MHGIEAIVAMNAKGSDALAELDDYYYEVSGGHAPCDWCGETNDSPQGWVPAERKLAKQYHQECLVIKASVSARYPGLEESIAT